MPSAADDTSASQPDASEALVGGVRPPPGPPRLLRRAHPPQPGAARSRLRRPCRSSRWRASRSSPGRGPSTGCTRPGAAGPPPHLDPRGARVDGADPDHVRRRLRGYAFGDLDDRCFAMAGMTRARTASMTSAIGRATAAVGPAGDRPAPRWSPGPGAPATWPTSGPTSSRSSDPRRRHHPADGLARPAATA